MDPCGGEDPRPETLADLGEWELIRRLGAFAPEHQFSDDAAVVAPAPPGSGELVINTDVLVEGIHFSDATTGAADVGWRAAAANLSDLAAMGCTEVVGVTVGLVAPPSTPWAWVEGVYRGIEEVLAAHGGVLLGGDCSSGAQRLLAITALGRLPGEASGAGAIRRGDGRPGDSLVSTGPHGFSRLGLALLQGELDPAWGETLDPTLRGRAIEAHRRPRPRLDVMGALAATRPAGTPWRVGGCDSSDGLGAAVAAVAAASRCSARLERDALPLEDALAAHPDGEAWCLGGGEDFELILALPPTWAAALVAALPGGRRIGRLESSADWGRLEWADGEGGLESEAAGFRHFSRVPERQQHEALPP
ncbi:MAG: thiamine-phosphate kinase [Synechococcaceae cyanobacterium]|nr:thiamine-phosphate kinase [Synechococcaceae cyanobacterium]